MRGYFESILHTIEESVMSMDLERFDELTKEAEKAICEGHKIIVSGLGKNVPVCEKFVGTMNSMGMDARYMNTNNAVHGDLGMVEEGDLVIVLTKSGETAESVYLTQLLMERKSNIWLLTFSNDSSIEKMIGTEHCVILTLEHEGDLWNIVPNNSTTVNLIVLQGLAITLAEQMNISLKAFKKNHPGGHIGVQLKEKV